jgi:hypothetical protein
MSCEEYFIEGVLLSEVEAKNVFHGEEGDREFR